MPCLRAESLGSWSTGDAGAARQKLLGRRSWCDLPSGEIPGVQITDGVRLDWH
jgi:hypothetical protein